MAATEHNSTPRRRMLFAFPAFHFMGFAPLDAWARVIASARAGGGPGITIRYWPRLGFALATSVLGTAITLPERLITAVLQPRTPAPPATLFVLGYYRSGTTHLHYLLSCDPRLATPRWYQMLAPQGFAASWTLLRFLLVPFLSSKRPQDDVAYGPEYPAEDDFGLCNLAGIGTMPGRMILPGCWEHYRRYQTLEGLTPKELEGFRRAQTTLSWKLAALNPGRRLLLKTPAHTARVRELVGLYGPQARFIHLHREPTSVLRSNVAMHRRLEPFLLQDHPGDEVIRDRIVEEYDRTERAFLADLDRLPDRGRGVVARVRYEDLIADPIGQLARAYGELGLTLSPEFAARLVGYLRTVESYRAASEKPAGESDGRDRIEPAAALEWMRSGFGHDMPSVPKADPARRAAELLGGAVPEPSLAAGIEQTRELRAVVLATLLAAAFTLAWVGLAAATLNRNDWLVWPLGIAVGMTALKSAGRGTLRLGLLAGAVVLLAFLARAWPATFLSEPRYYTTSPDRWMHVWRSTRDGVLTGKNLVWLALGVMTAARYASREHVRPPGM